MNITSVKVRMANNCGSLLATADITFDNELTVKEIRVMNGKNGMFVAMPSRKGSDGKYRDYIYLEDKETKKLVSDVVIEAYKNEMNRDNPFISDSLSDDGLPFK